MLLKDVHTMSLPRTTLLTPLPREQAGRGAYLATQVRPMSCSEAQLVRHQSFNPTTLPKRFHFEIFKLEGARKPDAPTRVAI